MQFLHLYLLCCLIILCVTLLCAAKYGRGITGWIRILGAGVLLANVVILMPLPLLPPAETPGHSFALSLLGAFQTTTLDASYGDFMAATDAIISRDSFIYVFYRYLLSVLFVLSPILAGSIVFTFFEGAALKCKYFLYSHIKDVYYFSELNERSLMLADSIAAHTPALIVFCNTWAGTPFHNEAQERGYVPIKSNWHDLNCNGQHRLYFFGISRDMSNGVNDVQRLIQKFAKRKNIDRIQIYLFTDQPDVEIIMDATDKKGLSVTVINEPVTMAYSLLFDIPLYTALEETGDDKLSVLIVGAGSTGPEIVKAAAWCGQMGDKPYAITVVDLDGAFMENQLRMECPELMDGHYQIRFLTADVRTCQFEQVLQQSCIDANYIIVNLGNDDLNIKTALYLRGFYFRHSPGFDREPVICVRVSNAAKDKSLRGLTAANRERRGEKQWKFSSSTQRDYNLHPFGSYHSVYAYTALVHSPLEKLALNVNAVYESTLKPDIKTSEIIYNYHANEVGKQSSRANAVHIRYKLYTLGFEMILDGDQTEETEAALTALQRMLDDPALLNRLAEMEHYRWNAFQRGQGYRGATVEQATIYKAQTNGSHIHRRAKLHPCICDWDQLPAIAALYDEHMIDYDKALIRHIPAMIGAVERPAFNPGGVRYVIKPL